MGEIFAFFSDILSKWFSVQTPWGITVGQLTVAFASLPILVGVLRHLFSKGE